MYMYMYTNDRDDENSIAACGQDNTPSSANYYIIN